MEQYIFGDITSGNICLRSKKGKSSGKNIIDRENKVKTNYSIKKEK